MFTLIFLKELRDIIQSSRFTISFAACSVLIILGFLMGAQNYLGSLRQYEAAIEENRNQIAAETNWAQVDNSIMLPPRPLQALVNGISNDIGRTIPISGRGELRPQNTRFNDEPLFAIFRFMDLEFIFGIVLSLFAIIFAYDSVNGEKQNGTLKLCFSNAVSRAAFIGGKLAGSFVGLSIALLIPILIGCALLPVLGITLTQSEWIRLGLIILSGLTYFGIFLAIAMGISASTARPSTSFLLCLVVWIFSVLIIPRASVLVSGRLIEVPNVDEIASQKNQYRLQLFDEDREKMASFEGSEETEPQDLMREFSSFMGELAEERTKKVELFSQRLNEDYLNKQTEQTKLALRVSKISPSTVFTLASTELAGTSLHLQNVYLESANSYQEQYGKFIAEKTGQNSGSGFRMIVVSSGDGEEEPETLDPEEMPQFEFAGLTTEQVLERSVIDIGLLVLFNIIFFGGAFYAFLRYDLR